MMPSGTSTEPSPFFGARMAGALWLTVILVSIVALIAGISLDLHGDPGTMAANALASASKIRLAFVLFFFGKICYLGGTVLLYELLKPVNKSVALFGAFCGLAGLLSGGAGHFNLLTALSLLEESRRATDPVASQLQGAANILLRTAPRFGGEDVWFGFQILSVGYLIVRSSFIPRAIGVLLVLGGLSFLATSFTNFVSPALGDRLAPLLLPIVLLGESALALWLVFRGVNVDQWRLAIACPSTLNPVAR
jgi:Domain of unknown function (DUF4386)